MATSRSFLFVTWEGGGNVPPVLGLARRLIARGHRVRVLTEPCLREAVEGIGAAFVPFTEHFTREDRTEDLMQDWKAKSPPAAIKRTLDRVVIGPAEIVARETERALDAEPADVLAVDFLTPGAAVVGEARGITTAFLEHSIDFAPGPGRPAGGMRPMPGLLGRLRDGLVRTLMHRTVDAYLPTLNALRARYGLHPLRRGFDLYRRADRVLVQTSRAFDFPASPAPANVRYVGPVLDEPDWVEAQAWDDPWAEGDPRPLVLVSLSSTFQNQRGVLAAAIAALGRLSVRGLVTLGPAMRGEPFEVPGNVVVVEQAPHAQVFPHASAFVTHCGHGSVMRALAHGVPLVALPMGRDQDDIAARIVEHGLGLRPKRTPEAIAAATRRVLSEPAFRAAAERMAETIAKDAAEDRGVAELEALAEQAPRPVPTLATTAA